MEDRPGTEKSNARHDLRGDARRVAVRPAVGREPDLGQVDRQMGEERGADTDENIGTQARRLAGELTLEADRAAENGGQRQLEKQHELQRLAQIGERRRAGGALQQGEQRDYRALRARRQRISRSRTSPVVVSGDASP